MTEPDHPGQGGGSKEIPLELDRLYPQLTQAGKGLQGGHQRPGVFRPGQAAGFTAHPQILFHEAQAGITRAKGRQGNGQGHGGLAPHQGQVLQADGSRHHHPGKSQGGRQPHSRRVVDPEVAGGLEGEVGITPARLPDQAQVSKLQGIGVEPGHGGEHIRHPGKLSLPHQPIPGEIEFDSLLPGRVPPVREFGEDLGIRVPGQMGRHPSHSLIQGDGQRFPVVDGHH